MSQMPIFGTKADGRAYVPRDASYAVIRNDTGKIAFVRGQSHVWFVGGGAEDGESEEDTIRREVIEETGCELRDHRLIGRARQYFEVDGVHYDMRATFFEGTLGERVSAPQETIVWLDREQASPELFHDSHRWAIARCDEMPGLT